MCYYESKEVDLKVQSTKTEMSERIVRMRPELLEVVKSALHRQKQIRLVSGTQTNLLFPWVDGGHMHYEAYSKYFRDHVRKTIGHSLPVHSLRHTYTSLMAEEGVPIEVISRQLGHADSKVTRDIYMHVTEERKKKDANLLDNVRIM